IVQHREQAVRSCQKLRLMQIVTAWRCSRAAQSDGARQIQDGGCCWSGLMAVSLNLRNRS
ncbi:unnamed protein product, partial [Symbiodinium pilosum]